MTKRKAIPKEIKTRLLSETLYRCASCLCSIEYVDDKDNVLRFGENAHIEPHSATHDNSFENLIVLCPNCHSKYDNTKDKKEMKKRLKELKIRWMALSGQYSRTEIDCLLDLYTKKELPWTSWFVASSNEYENKIRHGLRKRHDILKGKDAEAIQKLAFWQFGLEYNPFYLLKELGTVDLENPGIVSALEEIGLNKEDVEKMRKENLHFALNTKTTNSFIFRNILEKRLVFRELIINNLDDNGDIVFSEDCVLYLTKEGEEFCKRISTEPAAS